MTGLDPCQDSIIEIATLVTDSNLEILAEGPTIAIQQSEMQLLAMDDWNVCTHTKSGLISRVRSSGFDMLSAESATLEFLKKWVMPKQSPICGNSIAQDRRFLSIHMPNLEAYFHYRYIDVSTLKELATRWNPSILSGLNKKQTHRALDDIHQSVLELEHYRKYFLIPSNKT